MESMLLQQTQLQQTRRNRKLHQRLEGKDFLLKQDLKEIRGVAMGRPVP